MAFLIRARRTSREIVLIALRHIALPINAIIFAVVLLLIMFGETREGLFLGTIVLINILLGFGQDLRAWLLLERLQLLTLPKITRVSADGERSEIAIESVSKGDLLALKLGDQAPTDGIVVSSTSLEVNEGLITGESDSFPRGEGAGMLAGSVVTAGTGVMRADTAFAESRMAAMARGLARYSANPSPIQQSVETIIRYTVLVLLAVALFVIARGVLQEQAAARIVEQIGALASVLVPQGLVVATTLLFTYGAGHFYNRHVLLQEINATEKFGRVKNLCMDKTGTLTENELAVEQFLVPPAGDHSEARDLAALYVRHSGDSSQTIKAVESYIGPAPERAVLDVLSFSSWRHYGGIAVAGNSSGTAVLVGAPEIFSPHVSETERAWLTEHTESAVALGKRALCMVRAEAASVPHELSRGLSLAGVFILTNQLREGVQDAVNFFQNRGVTIRILSGDHPSTVRAIAAKAGIKNTEALITGPEMKAWDAADYAHTAPRYTLFARIEPEQKERLIEAFKLNGFTAMIGDGANDALSVKKADLGIAIYDGATATRQIAAVVLMRNSFVELPAGVRLADSMIENIEIFGAIFMNSTFLQFFFFLSLAVIGDPFPLSPLHITFLNYFTVGVYGLLISYWAITPPERTTPASVQPFLERVLPLPLALSMIQTLGAIATYLSGQLYFPNDPLPSLLIAHIVVTGFLFFALASEVASGGLSRARRLALWTIGGLAGIGLFYALRIPFAQYFFGVAPLSRPAAFAAVGIGVLSGLVMYLLTKIYFSNIRKP
ncbi:HAD-IC family P-type ATPase [Candidatus Kaiserbacteria bacterium]|nr:HAD-IC family P-type ATPase [Candidatus Kaiserbacteria bacterium]